jgi:hypothetical protein
VACTGNFLPQFLDHATAAKENASDIMMMAKVSKWVQILRLLLVGTNTSVALKIIWRTTGFCPLFFDLLGIYVD